MIHNWHNGGSKKGNEARLWGSTRADSGRKGRRPLLTVSCMQVRSIGKRDCGNLFKLGDDMIQFGGLHALLAASVADMLPVNVGLLLSEDAKRQSRAATAKRAASGALPHEDGHGAAVKSFEGLMNSPWKVG